MICLCDMLMSAGAAPGGGRDVRGYEHGRVVVVARVGDPSRELERVVARPELGVLHLQLREAPFELCDARAERRHLESWCVMGVPGSSSGPNGEAGPQSMPSSSKPARGGRVVVCVRARASRREGGGNFAVALESN